MDVKGGSERLQRKERNRGRDVERREGGREGWMQRFESDGRMQREGPLNANRDRNEGCRGWEGGREGGNGGCEGKKERRDERKGFRRRGRSG
ncbi:hypothetical protein Pmani_019749 [Petrolisthes manimaculis]|uniref:Uncharacterized protein n=1 Tax=Petrolisthes manimaculis TaxID=1843537 RepID=A0AAE1PHI7_9EUCA|nr:hypothetical protein Pmani_019749 [Petrolisthes manimaculis]